MIGNYLVYKLFASGLFTFGIFIYYYRYKSSWELNCRDSEQFREACPSLCRRAQCEEFWPVIEDEHPNKPFKAWGTWSRCSKTCGGGERSRTRECKAPRHNPCSEGMNIHLHSCIISIAV